MSAASCIFHVENLIEHPTVFSGLRGAIHNPPGVADSSRKAFILGLHSSGICL